MGLKGVERNLHCSGGSGGGAYIPEGIDVEQENDDDDDDDDAGDLSSPPFSAAASASTSATLAAARDASRSSRAFRRRSLALRRVGQNRIKQNRTQ